MASPFYIKKQVINQLLFCLAVIDVELGKEDHSSIPRNCDRKGVEPLYTRTDTEPDLTGGEKQQRKISN
jgi:hypothetical protein